MGFLVKSIEILIINFYLNIILNCEFQSLVENLIQKLNSVDNQLFMIDVKENFKINFEFYIVLVFLILKIENGDF